MTEVIIRWRGKAPRKNPIRNFQGTNRLLPRQLGIAKDFSDYRDDPDQWSAFLNWTLLDLYVSLHDVNFMPASLTLP